jgi:hypothetical protein
VVCEDSWVWEVHGTYAEQRLGGPKVEICRGGKRTHVSHKRTRVRLCDTFLATGHCRGVDAAHVKITHHVYKPGSLGSLQPNLCTNILEGCLKCCATAGETGYVLPLP